MQAERASSIPVILSPNLHLHVQESPRAALQETRTLQPPTSMQELTINLPKNPRLRGSSHHHHCDLETKQRSAMWMWVFPGESLVLKFEKIAKCLETDGGMCCYARARKRSSCSSYTYQDRREVSADTYINIYRTISTHGAIAPTERFPRSPCSTIMQVPTLLQRRWISWRTFNCSAACSPAFSLFH